MKERLRAIRIENGLTQKQLAQILNSTNKNIWAYENGIATPPIEILIAYAESFNVSVDYLLGRTDELGAPVTLHQNLTEEERSFLELFRQLSRGERAQLLAFSAGLLGKKRPDMKFWE